jgi:aminoglycoside phosphotransferase family enzyme/predicted kinase
MTADRSRPPAERATAAIETHISRLWFSPDRVYKMLKPVAFDFLDLTDRHDRLAATTRELELNRRFAPDVYLGAADVVEAGELVERMVVLRRLPEARRLSALLDDPDFDELLRSVARRVAALHAAADPILDAPMARRDRVERNWRDNFAAIEPHVGPVIDADEFALVRRLALGYLAGRDTLFDARIADGFVVDGHGDLTADDIFCLDDGPRLLDCLAFDDDLRIADVLADIGFLVMDVQRLTNASTALQLMTTYQEFGDEHHPASLAHHYVAYRAHVRAKVACLRFAQGDAASSDIARSYHRLVLDHLERARVRLVLVGGGAGAGKTTVAHALADRFGYVRLSTDEIRHDVTGIPHDQHRFVEPGTDIYAPEAVDATYAELARETALLIARGHSVVLDASWSRDEHRTAIREVAERFDSDLVEIECVVDPAVARERIERRRTSSWNPSDATPDVVDYLAARRTPWPTASMLSTADAVEAIIERAAALVDR